MSIRLAVLSTHPIQYQAPLFRELGRRRDVDFTALFCDAHGVSPSFDAQFGKVIRYDVPLLDDYRTRFLSNRAIKPGVRPTGLLNPEILTVLAAGEYDVLVLHGYNYLTSILTLLGPRRRTRLILRGESHLRPPRRRLVRAAKRVALPALFARADHFLSIGSLNSRYYQAYGVPVEYVTLAPYSVDNRYFSTRAAASLRDVSAARRRFGLPPRQVLFLVAAKLIEKKRPLDALLAFATVRSAGADCGLVYVGDGDLRPALEREIARRHLQNDVLVLGFQNQSQMPDIYGACDVLILPSQNEPWGLVVNEALASGMMAIVSDQVGSGVDLVDPSCIFPAGNVPALSSLMCKAATESEWLDGHKASSRHRIDCWDIAQTADAFVEGARIALRRPARFL